MHTRTCQRCSKIYKTEFYFSFYCNQCSGEKIDVKIDNKQKLFGIASYSGDVSYLKYILKQKNWIKLLNKPTNQEFKHYHF